MWVTLVPVANRPECALALKSGFALAKKLNGCVLGTHIRAHREMAVVMPDDMQLTSAMETQEQWAENESEAVALENSAEAFFKEQAALAGFEVPRKIGADCANVAFWQERVGTPQFIMPIIGPASDMLIVSRPARKESRKARIFMLQALMNSHRPVLVLPQEHEGDLLGHIAIGWNCSPEAARAVHSSMPVLGAAKKVTFLTVGSDHDLGPSAQEMGAYMARHGIKTDIVNTKGSSAGNHLLDVFRDSGADTLLMGAYSQSRWRERLFGGATQTMLDAADVPLLMMNS